MSRQALNERFLDEVIRYALAEIVDEIEKDLPSEEELKAKYKPSPALDARIQSLIQKERRKERLARMRKTALKVAAVIIAFLAVSFFTVMNVEALRLRIMNYFMERNEKSTTIRINNKENSSAIMPTYLPEGYENIHLEFFDSFYLAIFENKNGERIFLRRLEEYNVAGIDTESSFTEKAKVNGNNAEYAYKDGLSFLVFKYDDIVFILESKLPKDELIKIAESLEYTK